MPTGSQTAEYIPSAHKATMGGPEREDGCVTVVPKFVRTCKAGPCGEPGVERVTPQS